MKIVVKIGTQAILSPDGTLLEGTLSSIVRQVAELQKGGHSLSLVASGAVASGRRLARDMLGHGFGPSIGEKQVLASLGQPLLMDAYAQALKPHGLVAAQLLLTKKDFETRQHYLNIARLLHEILADRNIIPIINENDSVAVEELMFTDNDELSGLIAAQLNADKLIILTSVGGVFDAPPDSPGARLIPRIDPEKDGWPEAFAIKTAQGRGGMTSKLGTARRMWELGITTHIAGPEEKNVLLRLVKGDMVGTTLLPRRKKSNIKKWMAFNADKKNGVIRINPCLCDILKEGKRAVSLLPVGITHCAGDFRKGDLVEITAPDGKKIGVGIARYGADKLREVMGQKGKPEFIHYDYLNIGG